MDLRSEVMDYVARCAARGEGDPRALDRLLRAAKLAAEDQYAALTAPMAPETWEAIGFLPGDQAESQPVQITFPKPVEIVAFYSSIRATVAAGPHPTSDDVQVQIVIDKKEKITAAESVNSQSSASDLGYVTAGAMSVLTPRLVLRRIESPNPQIQFAWRWKAGAGVWGDSIPAFAVIARYI